MRRSEPKRPSNEQPEPKRARQAEQRRLEAEDDWIRQEVSVEVVIRQVEADDQLRIDEAIERADEERRGREAAEAEAAELARSLRQERRLRKRAIAQRDQLRDQNRVDEQTIQQLNEELKVRPPVRD
jgi:hypothetical protein